MARPKKDEPTAREAEFARHMVDNQCSAVEAARAVFGWKCDVDSKEARRAKDLARTRRVMTYMADYKHRQALQIQADKIVTETRKLDIDSIRSFLVDRLEKIRDSSNQKAQVRLNAIQALERMRTPGGDLALLVKWLEVLWRFAYTHCPACHKDFPLKKIPNETVDAYRRERNLPPPVVEEDRTSCRMDLLNYIDKRRTPHPSQQAMIAAPERHLVVTAPARCGKSLLMSMFAVMSYLLPGSDNWLISEAYKRSYWEVLYFKQFLKSLFHPNELEMATTIESLRDGEFQSVSRWGSSLATRTAKSKGAITGSELNLALVAEAGWVPEDLYEEVRARVSSRLGRILAFGTPKGSQRFLVRMMRATGRDPKTKKIVRLSPNDRLIESGCPWGDSVRIAQLQPRDNPQYVVSELDSARRELTDEEYESEFEGKVVERSGAKFHAIKPEHLVNVRRDFFSKANYVLGIDQGPTNFAAILIAWDGKTMVPCYEFFDSSEKTMRANLIFLRQEVPKWIRQLGGDAAAWRLTIFDRDPPVWGMLTEMEAENLAWPTAISSRHENKRNTNDNWRRDVAEFINASAKSGSLIFQSEDGLIPNSDDRCIAGCVTLHQEAIDVLDKPDEGDNEQARLTSKGWVVVNPWRKDHPLDAWLLAMWAIYTGQLPLPVEAHSKTEDIYAEQRLAMQQDLSKREQRELKSHRSQLPTDMDINTPLFESSVGPENWNFGYSPGFYSDES